MATKKEMEDNLKNFIIQEQTDAHNFRNINIAKYNNIKLEIDPIKFPTPHIMIRISISEAVFSLEDFKKINGGLGYEERIVFKWFNRYGVKDRLHELWVDISNGQSNKTLEENEE